MSSRTESQAEIESLLAEFQRVRRDLIAAAFAVPPDLTNTPFVGSWDIKDVIAHTVGWDYTNIEALPDFRAGRLPAFFDAYDSDWASVNAGLIARYREEDWDALLESVRVSGDAFVAAMRELSDADLDRGTSWGQRRVTLRGMMRAVSRDESEHVAQVRALLAQEPGR